MALEDPPELCSVDDCRRLKGHKGNHDAYPSAAWGFLDDASVNKLTKAGFATPRGGAKGAYQNHVVRSNKVIIPYEFVERVDLSLYEDGYVIRLFPNQYFETSGTTKPEFMAADARVKVGVNAFILYRTHESFERFPPPAAWQIRHLTKRINGVNVKVAKRGEGVDDAGEYVLRLPTLGKARQQRSEGPPQGLFATEYADAETNYLCKCVLAWLIVQTSGSPYTMIQAAHLRAILQSAELGDTAKYEDAGVLRHQITQCPLCLRFIKFEELHDTVSFEEESGLENAGHQVEGATRSTIVNLFHLRPLFYHSLVHVPGNVAWGHAVCNTRLGQRPCYSLAEINQMGRKVGFILEEEVVTFGWMSEDDTMIRSNGGAVWIQIAREGSEGPPDSTEQVIDAAAEPTETAYET